MQPVAGMYELFILGKLMHRPMHGYVLQSIINAALGPFRRLSWGTLYPLLRRLEEAGYIAAQRGKSIDGRGTRNYRTTAPGRNRFFELMRSPIDGDYRDVFRIKVSNFGHIKKADQQMILEDYRTFLEAIVNHSEAMAREVVNAPGLITSERPYVLLAVDHQRHLAASEIAWLDALIEHTGGKGEHSKGTISTPDRKPRRARTRAGSNSRR